MVPCVNGFNEYKLMCISNRGDLERSWMKLCGLILSKKRKDCVTKDMVSSYICNHLIRTSKNRIGAFHLVRTHLGWVGGVKPPIHFHCVLHAKRGWVGPDSM